ncbi:MAG: molybdenum cofactor guanylyltransferase [Acidobacteriota bacterium]|nr:molybdenum cofactor guanylyltransferase [Acidobacteriota bacterium]
MNCNALSGFVLVGGKSSRMKTDKAFLQINGETFLERAVKTLQNVVENRVDIVLNQTQKHFIERIPGGVPCVFDVFENRGALGGIHAALKNCATEYAIIIAVDLPNITVETVEKLAEIALSSNEFNAVVPRQNDGRLQPLCAVYRAADCLPPLEKLLRENDSASVRDFLERLAPRFINQNQLTEDQSNDIFFNVNRPTDFQQIN